MRFEKYHALGNDYIVINPHDLESELTPERIRLLCHRNYGIGSDGILLGPLPVSGCATGVRIFNPDGSEAEKSGNGLRIFSRYLYDQGEVGEEGFDIGTIGGVVRSRLMDSGRRVEIDMGKVSFHSADIPVSGAEREVLQEEITVAGREFTYSAATIGNPHCVIACPEASKELACRYGPLLEVEARFPNRTNVQFMEVLDRNNIRIEIWERGAAYTLASGSSSCAAAAVAHRLGYCDAQISVHMPGGVVEIKVNDGYRLTMAGPVTRVFSGVLCQ